MRLAGYTFPMKSLPEQAVEALTPWQKQGVLAALTELENGAPTFGHEETMAHLRALLEKMDPEARTAES